MKAFFSFNEFQRQMVYCGEKEHAIHLPCQILLHNSCRTRPYGCRMGLYVPSILLNWIFEAFKRIGYFVSIYFLTYEICHIIKVGK